MRLVDADKISEEISQRLKLDGTEKDKGLFEARRMVDYAPTVEAIPIENIEFLMKDGEIYSGRNKIEAPIEPFNKLVWDNCVAYNREWLRKRASEEFNIVTGKQAITIEWIKKWAKKNGLDCYDYDYPTEKNDWWYAIEKMLEDWRKENEC